MFNVCTVNVNSLMSKVHYINNIALEYDLHIISVTETWLTEDCNSSFVQLPEYMFYRGDVEGSIRKHGAGLYIAKSLKHVEIDTYLPNIVAVHLLELDIHVVSIYRPPSYSADENDKLLRFIEEFSLGVRFFFRGILIC